MPDTRVIAVFCVEASGPSTVLFGSLKKHAVDNLFRNNEEAAHAVRGWLKTQDPDFYHNGIFNLMPQPTVPPRSIKLHVSNRLFHVS
jgi:hypothetical protein